MSAGKEMGSAPTPPKTARREATGSLGRYHGPADPHKSVRFAVDGKPLRTKGKAAAFLRALMAAGSEGVAHVDVMPWHLNPGDAAKALRDRGVRIETRKGSPSRWVLQSQVHEVRS